MGSTRLPGKVLKSVLGKPLLWYLFERLKTLHHNVQLLLATTTASQDEQLVKFGEDYGIQTFAGNEDDVLDRYYQAAIKTNADVIVRLTGDCPLIDPEVVDKCLDAYFNGLNDYVCNRIPPTYPDGLDTEVFSERVLQIAWREARLKSEREHVTPFIYNHPERFTIYSIKNKVDWSKYRLTVDEAEDFELIKTIICHFQERWNAFSTLDIISFIEKDPKIMAINKKFIRDEGYAKSLREDKSIK